MPFYIVRINRSSWYGKATMIYSNLSEAEQAVKDIIAGIYGSNWETIMVEKV